MVVKKLRKLVSNTHPLRLLYHKLFAVMGAIWYRFPSRKMTVIGVTGTNGKTTTVNLVAHILESAGHKVGMTSTINFQIGDKKWSNKTKMTSLGRFGLQKMLRRMANAGCEYAVIEVSSHAMTQSRVWGINIDVGAFTNVTEDHIEYHGSKEKYLVAKGELFKKISSSKRKSGIPKLLVLNQGDPNFDYFDRFVADRKLNYGIKAGTVRASSIKLRPDGSDFVLNIPNQTRDVKFGLPGDFNIENVLCAASICLGLNIDFEKIVNALESAKTVPGRYDHVNAGQDPSIVIDYAHAPDSLEKLLSMYRDLTLDGKLYAVFGATGGGRDRKKRPKMGKVADKYADYVVVTNDDPYDDDEISIIDDVSEGIDRKEGEGFWKIPDRREAIRLVLALAKKGDSVVIAGKGAEEVMKIRGGTIPWNDKATVVELLRRDISVGLVE